MCAVSWATWLLFTSVPTRSIALRLQSPGPLGSCSPVRPFGVLLCLCGVLDDLAPVHRCACVVCRVACAVSWVTWLLFTGEPARCVVLCVGCPWSPGSCSPVCPLGVLLCVCGVLGHLAPVHQCAWPWCPIPLLCLVLVRAWCPGPCGACSLACALCPLCVCRWWFCFSSSPPNFFSFFVPSRLFFFSSEKIDKTILFFLKTFLQRRGCAYTAGTSMGNWCSGAILSCSLACVVSALAVAPQGCGSRVLMYTGMGQDGFG